MCTILPKLAAKNRADGRTAGHASPLTGILCIFRFCSFFCPTFLCFSRSRERSGMTPLPFSHSRRSKCSKSNPFPTSSDVSKKSETHAPNKDNPIPFQPCSPSSFSDSSTTLPPSPKSNDGQKYTIPNSKPFSDSDDSNGNQKIKRSLKRFPTPSPWLESYAAERVLACGADESNRRALCDALPKSMEMCLEYSC